ncbi:MAG TPA: trypsin-like serine protease, partial [Kofleriaceae bacterium]|nr:trypsin-like serine protease [Kofleriaceae bacterium]
MGTYTYPTSSTALTSCTATLISPTVVLVAAHCLSPAYTGTTVPAGAMFNFTDSGGVARSYAVDRIQAFATKRFEYVPQGTFTTDLAILHLSAQVPTSQALPADLALQEPYGGESSTVFGFGCTDRTPQSGGGYKQYKTFNFGSATTALCWGDSGGPVVYGGVS